MDTDSIPRSILLILALVLVSGFFAGAETAYANCSRIRLKAWADDGKKSASRALTVLEKFDKAIAEVKCLQKKYKELQDLYKEEHSKYITAMEQYRASTKNE